MIDLKFEHMSQRALVDKCHELTEELSRARGGLADSMDRNADLRYRNTKLVRVRKKAKGKIDAASKRFIKESAIRSVLSNMVALAISIPASLSDGSFTPYLVLSGVVSGVLVPLQTYISKRQEEV
jgi:hypothetical protein